MILQSVCCILLLNVVTRRQMLRRLRGVELRPWQDDGTHVNCVFIVDLEIQLKQLFNSIIHTHTAEDTEIEY